MGKFVYGSGEGRFEIELSSDLTEQLALTLEHANRSRMPFMIEFVFDGTTSRSLRVTDGVPIQLVRDVVDPESIDNEALRKMKNTYEQTGSITVPVSAGRRTTTVYTGTSTAR